MDTVLTIDPAVANLRVGLVEARAVTIAEPDPMLLSICHAAVAKFLSQGPEGGDLRRQAVRRLLRLGGFKPSGRNKPAQEYLAGAARSDAAWPTILNAVDLLNIVSLQSGLPISLIAAGRASAPLLLRYGRPSEQFVFNTAGQSLDLQGLLCICQSTRRDSQPIATPVKDSQFAKVTPNDQHLLACIYSPRDEVPERNLVGFCERLAEYYRQWCRPEAVTWQLVAVED